MSFKAARRYAYAMFQSAVELGILEECNRDMDLIHETIEAASDLELFLKSPIIKKDDKRQVLLKVFEKNVTKETIVLIHLLVSKGRESTLKQIAQRFSELYKEHKNILDVEVQTAFELDDQQTSELRKALENVTRKIVHLKTQVDVDLKGGLAVRIHDTMYDGTVRHKMSQLKQQFSRENV